MQLIYSPDTDDLRTRALDGAGPTWAFALQRLNNDIIHIFYITIAHNKQYGDVEFFKLIIYPDSEIKKEHLTVHNQNIVSHYYKSLPPNSVLVSQFAESSHLFLITTYDYFYVFDINTNKKIATHNQLDMSPSLRFFAQWSCFYCSVTFLLCIKTMKFTVFSSLKIAT